VGALLDALAVGVLEILGFAALALGVLMVVALALATGDDVADTAGGKLGGTAATAFVRLESRLSAWTTKTNAITANAATPTINPRLYMAVTIRPLAFAGQSRSCSS
jgi:hypothetical protein